MQIAEAIRTSRTIPEWRRRKRRRELISRVVAYTFTSLLALLFAAPFLWLVSMSLQTAQQLSTYPPSWIPRPVQWSNYVKAMTNPWRPFHIFFRNSFIYTGLGTLGVTLSSAFVAFGFSRVTWKGRDAFFVLVLATMMLPGEVTMIPQYIIFKYLRWLDSLKPLIVPMWLGSAFDIFLLRQFFLTIPRELDEAAIIDGCDYFSILWRVIMPLSKPAVVTVVAFAIVGTWNNFMGPLIYVTTKEKMPVALGLRIFQAMSGDTGAMIEYGQIMAAAVATLIPMLILFIAAQRYFVTGIAMTGLKG
ncbi:MAG: carbohydrate ABC transporter permease [Chloroflexi bacterium]|nr:carbohydrate ABC transporter permease [Chloroflexota bacterium]